MIQPFALLHGAAWICIWQLCLTLHSSNPVIVASTLFPSQERMLPFRLTARGKEWRGGERMAGIEMRSTV